MTADIRTLTGSAYRTGPAALPSLRLCGDPAEQACREGLTPINNCLLLLENEMRRLMSLLGGDTDEWMDNLETLSRKVMGRD
jgi:hypothetical protein